MIQFRSFVRFIFAEKSLQHKAFKMGCTLRGNTYGIRGIVICISTGDLHFSYTFRYPLILLIYERTARNLGACPRLRAVLDFFGYFHTALKGECHNAVVDRHMIHGCQPKVCIKGNRHRLGLLHRGNESAQPIAVFLSPLPFRFQGIVFLFQFFIALGELVVPHKIFRLVLHLQRILLNAVPHQICRNPHLFFQVLLLRIKVATIKKFFLHQEATWVVGLFTLKRSHIILKMLL